MTDSSDSTMVGLEQRKVSFWKRFCPALAVYLPKYVCIHNPRLAAMNNFFTFMCIVCTIYYFISNDKYLLLKVPSITINPCGALCSPTAVMQDNVTSEGLAMPYCTSAGIANYSFGESRYSAIQCAERCGKSTVGSCLRLNEFVQTSDASYFIPTFYRETVIAPLEDNIVCPAGLSVAVVGGSQVCQSISDYFVAAAEEGKVIFSYEINVAPAINTLAKFMKVQDLKAHSGSFHSLSWDSSMKTILFDSLGHEVKQFEQPRLINLSLAELVASAYHDDFDDQGPLSLDSVYSRPELNISSEVPLRLTGVFLTIDIFVTDQGTCKVFDRFRDQIGTVKVAVGSPVACLFVHAERKFTMVEKSVPLGYSGASRTRLTMGARIEFRNMGKFNFLDEQAIIQNLTVFFVWIQVPLIMTTTFAITALGYLSDVYSRVIHQELNVPESCKGLAARLVSHSAAFMDLQDQQAGTTRKRIYDRFNDYLKNSDVIDEEELSRFVDFVFEGLKSFGEQHQHAGTGGEIVTIQEFCAACSSNEPLNFETLVKLFDKDRKQGIIERMFLDDAIGQVRRAAILEDEEDDSLDTEKNPENVTKAGYHSRLEQAVSEVQGLMTSLAHVEGKVRKAAQDLDVGEEFLALFGDDEELEDVPAFALPPKKNQDADNISIASETDLGAELAHAHSKTR